jgi:hypothetical protein
MWQRLGKTVLVIGVLTTAIGSAGAAPAADRPMADEPAAGKPAGESPAAAPPAAGTPGAADAASRAASLDLESLENRLRNTQAIGVLTKLSLKNQVDDLLERFRAFHRQRAGALPELRQRYDLLLMKVLSLLQDRDPALAGDIAGSRDALWSLLVDPATFAQI